MLGMFGKKQWPLYAFLGLAVIMAGCKKKVEPQLPIVIVEKPVKKKYNRKQVARLIVITALKNVFSIQEISQTLALLTDEDQSQKRYDDFVACMNGEKMDDLPPVVVSACQTLKLYFQTHELVHALEGESHEN